MQWKSEDMKQYIKAKEYVDTLLIPLIPFNLVDENIEKGAFQSEVMELYVNETEKNLMGRVMLLPNYYYLNSKDLTNEVKRVNEWITQSENDLFKHVFLLTFDPTWKRYEKSLDGTLLWLPGMYSGNIYSEEIARMVSDQVNELIELIRSYW